MRQETKELDKNTIATAMSLLNDDSHLDDIEGLGTRLKLKK